MSISTAFRRAFQVCMSHKGATVKFLVTELCLTLASLTPALFLFDGKLRTAALLAVPFYVLLMLPARVNAAAAMQDSLGSGSLFSLRLADPSRYGAKLLFGLKRALLLAVWSAPLIACLVIARQHFSGETDAFTVLRLITDFGGGDLMTGVLYLLLILAGALLLTAAGTAFHSGDRHAYVLEQPGRLKGHRGGVMLCWLCSLVILLPLLCALAVTVCRYLPALSSLDSVLMGMSDLPSTRTSLIILGVGAALTVPLLPLRSMVIAAYVNGLGEKE